MAARLPILLVTLLGIVSITACAYFTLYLGDVELYTEEGGEEVEEGELGEDEEETEDSEEEISPEEEL